MKKFYHYDKTEIVCLSAVFIIVLGWVLFCYLGVPLILKAVK